jgi:hypothetical protein
VATNQVIRPAVALSMEASRDVSQVYQCPCCAYLTLTEKSPGTFQICPVRSWEDDNIQAADPRREGGANSVSLEEARRNFTQFGAASKDALLWVRKPIPREVPE